jgi:hypothetical protein
VTRGTEAAISPHSQGPTLTPRSRTLCLPAPIVGHEVIGKVHPVLVLAPHRDETWLLPSCWSHVRGAGPPAQHDRRMCHNEQFTGMQTLEKACVQCRRWSPDGPVVEPEGRLPYTVPTSPLSRQWRVVRAVLLSCISLHRPRGSPRSRWAGRCAARRMQYPPLQTLAATIPLEIMEPARTTSHTNPLSVGQSFP